MQGSCLCGAVAFEVDPPLRDVVVCHCTQCRKTSGHYWAASSVPLENLRFTNDDGLAWYRSSPSATRGFCWLCGSSLFWKPEDEDRMSLAAGALHGATGLRIAKHIFVEDGGDYYAPERAPQQVASAKGRVSASCLCSEVHFTLPAPSGGIGACHCHQCRKLSGHFTASFDCDEAQVEYQRRATLAEYATSGGGRRGFCTGCGSSLYFRSGDGGFSVEAGAVDGPTGLRLESHIFVADKGDYYDIDDGLPQYRGWD